MAEIDMPHNLPEAKKITFEVAGKSITVGASVLKAGEKHPWARKDHPTVVLKPLGDSLSENSEARDVLTNRKNDVEVRRQAIEKLSRELGEVGVENTAIVMLGAGTKFEGDRLKYV
jgi:hypothetical protein